MDTERRPRDPRRRGRGRRRHRQSDSRRDASSSPRSPPSPAPRSRRRSRSRSRSRSRERRRRPHDRTGMASPRRRDDAPPAHDDGDRRDDTARTPTPGRGRGKHGRDRGRGRSKLSVPDNWDDVPKIGALVASSRFVAMRVPLDAKFTRLIRSPHELWTPEIFLQTQASEGHDVRLLIDLTNTTRYYDGDAEFRDSGVKYVKLCIEGFKAPPRESEVQAFVRIVDAFVAAEPRGNIAVHCTHGLNRTGYLVVSYLVQRNGMSVQDALRAFSDARPPGLIKHMYIEDLFRRFAPDAHVELPQLPDWATAKYAARRR